MGRKSTTTPVYMKIAVDVASRIVQKEISATRRISGRSTLSGEYNVSPETIRKAMQLLADMNIVEVKHGNGIFVSSLEQARDFIETYRLRASVNELKEELMALMVKRDEVETRMNEIMNAIVDYASRFKNSEHVTVHEYHLAFKNVHLNKSLAALALWAKTGITVVGIKRDGHLMLSPSPDECLQVGDRLLYVGDAESSVKLGEIIRSELKAT